MESETQVRPVRPDDVRAMSPIPSRFQTDRVYRLQQRAERGGVTWSLREERLQQPFQKEYDSGQFGEWIEPYLEVAPLDELNFVAAKRGYEIVGLLTWQRVEWNDTLWLLD